MCKDQKCQVGICTRVCECECECFRFLNVCRAGGGVAGAKADKESSGGRAWSGRSMHAVAICGRVAAERAAELVRQGKR